MSRYFVQPESGIGPGGDIVFRRHPVYERWYLLWVGDKVFGQIMRDRRERWSGLSQADDSEFFGIRMMEGFADRMAAATFVIKHHGYWMQDERRRSQEMIKNLEKLDG